MAVIGFESRSPRPDASGSGLRNVSEAVRLADSPRSLPVLVAATVRMAWRAARGRVLAVVALSVVSCVGLALELLLARRFVAEVMRAHTGHEDVSRLLPIIVAMVSLATVMGFVSKLTAHHQRMLGTETTRFAQRGLLDVATGANLASFDRPAFHDAVARAQLGANRVSSLIGTLAGLTLSLSGMLAAAVALVILDPPLIALAGLAAAPLTLTASRRSRIMYAFSRRMTSAERERGYLMQLMSSRHSAQELRAYDLSPFLRQRWEQLYEHHVKELGAASRRQLRLTAITELLAGVLLAGGIAAALSFTLTSRVGLATAASAAVAVFALSQRLMAATASTSSLAEAAHFIEDYLRLQEMPGWSATTSERRSGGDDDSAPSRRPPQIVAQALQFAYPNSGEPVLRDVNLTIEPGEVVALVGPNGSGKTTLAKLLAGLYQPAGGRIEWDGENICETDPARLRASVAVVFQDFLRLALPVRDNIAVGRRQAFHDEPGIRQAAVNAGADEFIERLAEGYDTRLGPEYYGGTDISVGQWQRIALARAFFRGAPFVILDEPTSSLDAQSEHELFAAMRPLFPDRSILLISHRFATVRDADRIYVMQDGEIVESGNHEELLAAEGLYAQMFGLQATAYR